MIGTWEIRVLGLLVLVTVLATACGNDGGGRTGGTSPEDHIRDRGWARDVYDVNTLNEAAATADLVVRGKVTSVEKGRIAGGEDPDIPGEHDGDGAIQFYDVTVEVSETFRGPVQERIVVEQMPGYGGGLSQIGDDLILFLTPPPGMELKDSARLIPMNSASLFEIDGDDVFASSVEKEWTQELEALHPGEVEAAIREAGIKADSGETRPVEPSAAK